MALPCSCLCTIEYVLYPVHSTSPAPPATLNEVMARGSAHPSDGAAHRTLVYSTPYRSVQCTLYSSLHTMYSPPYRSVQSTAHNVQSTAHYVQSTALN